MYIYIKDIYNKICVSFPKLTVLSDKRKQAIKARLNKYTIDQIKEVFIKAEASDFLKGGNNRNWIANFDWLMKDGNIAKVLDGNYDNKASAKKNDKHGYAGYDLDLYENMLNKADMVEDEPLEKKSQSLALFEEILNEKLEKVCE